MLLTSRRAFSDAAKAWRAAAAKEAKKSGRTLESLSSTTAEGLEIDPVYFGDDGSEAPGVFPFTRGAYATMRDAARLSIKVSTTRARGGRPRARRPILTTRDRASSARVEARMHLVQL